MGASKDVVVGIPTLNCPSRLERCLKSATKYTPLALKYIAVST